VSPANVLVDTDWLAAHLEGRDAALCVVDVRGKVLPPGTERRYRPKREEYDEGHVPGAAFLDWTKDIVDPDDPVPVQIAKPEAFARRMGELGIGDGTTVVAYDDYDHAFAGRFAWALRYYGHDEVRILDGGWTRWIAEGRPTTTQIPERRPARFTPRPRPALRRSGDEVARAVERGDALLIDARAAEQYAGEVSVAAQAGHIPGARNVPYARLVDPSTGRFLPPRELTRVFAEAGVNVGALPEQIVVYCNGGVTCTVPLAALRLLGRDDVAVYDGSWNEWGNDPARPVRSGRSP
jgi:thiosulfate/3-mercaptopyruvate sulfurtransferase